MSKPTPGPLVADFNSTMPDEPRFRVYSKNADGNVALFYAKADADLFAATPDLVTSLKEANEALQTLLAEMDTPPAYMKARVERAVLAIMKAEGRE